MQQVPPTFRILIVDDNRAIHEDFRKILDRQRKRHPSIVEAESILFDLQESPKATVEFVLDSAYQGEEALEMVRTAVAEGRPYAVAFVDVRMPPGWDGVETITHLWQADPGLQAVVCTAYSDYSWDVMVERLGHSDSCLILKKPFDNIEVLQLCHALTRKWQVTYQAQMRLETLEIMVQQRTNALQRSNDELRRSEERFATAFQASPAAMAIQTLDDQRFVDVNEAFLQMTGFTREELLGRTQMDVLMLIDREQVYPGFLKTETANTPGQISTKSGEMKRAVISVERISIGGEPHTLLLAQDLSEQMRLEEQLRQSQKMEAIGQLAAGVAHDFNNLLTIIQGHSSLQLALHEHNPELEASLQEIEHAAGRAADLTRQLLAFSRRQIVRPRTIDLSSHLLGLSMMLRRLIGEDVELRCELAEDLPPIYADPTSIEQVVINLVVNARDATSQGGTIIVSTSAFTADFAYCRERPEASAGDYICLSVVDTGIGIDDETRRHIFEPFFTTKELHKGTGMGLATVYGIVRQHGGWVDVSSQPGSGSTFRVFIPVSKEPLDVPETEVVQVGSPARQHTILVVEDDNAVRSLVKEVLVHHGYHVLEAENADAAFRVWQNNREQIELLLTDMVMPGSANGLELARTLLAERPELKVIYTSGYSTELFRSDLVLRDGINYLPKPYMSSKLTSMLRNALEPKDSAEDSVSTVEQSRFQHLLH